MWLGVLAVIVAVTFAVIKFLTGVHWRRLRERRARLQNELNRNRLRVQSLDGTLQVERGRRGAIEQKLTVGRRFKDDLYHRLRLELPDPLVTEVRNCINHNPIPQPRGVRLFHELKIADKIARTLQSMAVGLFEFSVTDGEARRSLMDAFVALLEEAEVSHTRGHPQGEDGSASAVAENAVVCAFDQATTCMELIRTFIQQATVDQQGQVRGVLLAGVNANRHVDDDVSRLFARALDYALDFIARSPAGSLLMNAFAYEDLGDRRDGIELFDRAEQLYVFAWQSYDRADASPPEPAVATAATGDDPQATESLPEQEEQAHDDSVDPDATPSAERTA